MAQKVLVSGTSYELSGGKTLIGGAGYGISGGRTLVDGTGYYIAFAPKEYVVTVTLSRYTYVIYNDTCYSSDTILYVAPGDSVRCVVSAGLPPSIKFLAVRVNGAKVNTSSFVGNPPYHLPSSSHYYDFTPESDATITGNEKGAGNDRHGEIDITT